MDKYTYDDLCGVMYRLRKDCPWDRQQTHESLRSSIIEEVYELADVVNEGVSKNLVKFDIKSLKFSNGEVNVGLNINFLD